MIMATGAITTVWVLLGTMKHPQSHADAQLTLNLLNMTFHEKIGFLTWTRPQENLHIDVDTNEAANL